MNNLVCTYVKFLGVNTRLLYNKKMVTSLAHLLHFFEIFTKYILIASKYAKTRHNLMTKMFAPEKFLYDKNRKMSIIFHFLHKHYENNKYKHICMQCPETKTAIILIMRPAYIVKLHTHHKWW